MTNNNYVEAKPKKKLKKLGILSTPYLVWNFFLIIIPSLILIVMAFTTYDFSSNSEFKISLSNWSYVFGSSYAKTVFWPAMGRSFLISFLVTVICFLFAYPTAYFMRFLNNKVRGIIMLLLVLPLWSNQVLRIVSWKTIFEIIGLNESGFYQFNIVIAMISMYLPYMILPIYSVLEKIDDKVIEASYDLGANKFETFFKVTFPLSISGIISGIIMVFLPSLTQFEVSDAISDRTIVMLGNLIYKRFKGTGGFNVGSVFSLITIIFTVMGFILVMRVDKEGETLI